MISTLSSAFGGQVKASVVKITSLAVGSTKLSQQRPVD
jgi:hypothetical protein